MVCQRPEGIANAERFQTGRRGHSGRVSFPLPRGHAWPFVCSHSTECGGARRTFGDRERTGWLGRLGPMLILTRRVGESIRIGDDISVTVLSIQGNQIRIGIDAPKDVQVHREEVYERVIRERETGSAEEQ